MIKNLEQTLTKKVEDARSEVEESLFKKWKNAKTEQERESVHAELRALKGLTTKLIKSIRGSING